MLLHRVEIFFSTHCPTGPVAGKWPLPEFLWSSEECGSTSKAAVAGPGAQAFPGLCGAGTVPEVPGGSQCSCESPLQHLHVDIFYLRGLLASLALIYNTVVAGLQHCWNSLYFRKTLLWHPTGISAEADHIPAAPAGISFVEF